jgi:hypothetical protein
MNIEHLIEELEAKVEIAGGGANIGGHPCFVATFVLGIIKP